VRKRPALEPIRDSFPSMFCCPKHEIICDMLRSDPLTPTRRS
jgi:hypothetical protein